MSETEAERETRESTIGKLASRGEDAFRRIREEAEKSQRTSDALGKLDKMSHSVLHQLNIAPLDELEELRKEVGRLEERLAQLQGSAAPAKPAASGGDAGPGA